MKKIFSVAQITVITLMGGLLGMFHSLAQNYKNTGDEVKAKQFRTYGYISVIATIIIFSLLPDSRETNGYLALIMGIIGFISARSLQGPMIEKHLTEATHYQRQTWSTALFDSIVYGIITFLIGFAVGMGMQLILTVF